MAPLPTLHSRLFIRDSRVRSGPSILRCHYQAEGFVDDEESSAMLCIICCLRQSCEYLLFHINIKIYFLLKNKLFIKKNENTKSYAKFLYRKILYNFTPVCLLFFRKYTIVAKQLLQNVKQLLQCCVLFVVWGGFLNIYHFI